MSAIKHCRVCGKEYEYCHTFKHADGVFRWQDVACSPECGSKYLAAVMENRGRVENKTDIKIEKDAEKHLVEDISDASVYDEDDYDDDDDFEDDSDEDDEDE